MSARHDPLPLDGRQEAVHVRRRESSRADGVPGRDERRDRPDPDQRDGWRPSGEHPTPTAPLADWIGRTRFVVLIAVVGVVLVSIALFVIGAGLAVQGIWHAMLAAIRGELTATSITVDLLEVVSVMLKAVVFYLIGVGFYSLFIAPLNLTAALGIRSFNDLEIKVVSVVVVIMAVTFLEHFIRWDQAVETLLYGVSLGIVVAALVFFQMHSHREAREDEHENATSRIRAQREMFHADHEEREVRPDEAPEQRVASSE
ncbi:MAG: YqhA family protein [Chloroflexota bacterium]